MDLEDKDFKAAIINIMKELKKIMLKELNKGITMSHQIINISDQIQIKIMWLKSIITELKYSLEWLNIRFQLAEKKY